MSEQDMERYDRLLGAYDKLREQCWFLAKKNNGALMGPHAWLSHVLLEGDIANITAGDDGIRCSGYTYSSQTQENEWFEFLIPYEKLKEPDGRST